MSTHVTLSFGATTSRENGNLADDENLIGYYFTDVPLLVKKSIRYPAKNTIHDPELLKTQAGRDKIAKDTRQYYQWRATRSGSTKTI